MARTQDASGCRRPKTVFPILQPVRQPRLLSLLRVLDFGPAVSCHKAALELMGVCAAHATAPFPRLGERERGGIAAVLREHGLLPAQS